MLPASTLALVLAPPLLMAACGVLAWVRGPQPFGRRFGIALLLMSAAGFGVMAWTWATYPA